MPVDTVSIVERLQQHRTLSSMPRQELEWIAGRGTLRRVEAGDVFTQRPELTDCMWIVLSGQFAVYVDRGLGPQKAIAFSGGEVSGVLPYSRMTRPIGDGVAHESGDVFLVHRSHFPDLIRECPTLTATVVHLMIDRARLFRSFDLQDEKLKALGRVSAGLAHELNNPASAATRSIRLLIEKMGAAESAMRALAMARLTAAQFDAIDRTRSACLIGALVPPTPLERADREEMLAAWLDDHGIDAAAAGALVDTSISTDALEELAATLGRDHLTVALEWIAADCTSRALAAEVERTSTRVSNLVAAVKRFTYMDKAAVPESVDLAPGVRDSIALLSHKARTKSLTVTADLPDDLPQVRAIGGELNQIWTNLIDNAIDAAPDSGRVSVTAVRRAAWVIISVTDDGGGIKPEDLDRIFDPFYTTKPVGQGTGLGLDIVRQVVRRNGGDIDVESKPGRTEFRITLPVAST